MNFKKHVLAVTLMACSSVSMADSLIPAPDVKAKSYTLVDISTGAVIADSKPDVQTEIASLTKVMTAYVAFSELKHGTLNLNDEVHVSRKAWRTDGSKMFIEAGKKVKLDDILRGVIIVSGNDASVALAEHISGTEERFAELMNNYAKSLGMKNTRFANATGLPTVAEQHSSAHDLAILASKLYENFPEYTHYFKELAFTYNDITQDNRNRLLKESDHYRGMKTGYTIRSGYSIISSYKEEDRELVAIVLNSKKVEDRFSAAKTLINYGFRRFKNVTPVTEGQQITSIPVHYGVEGDVAVFAAESLSATIPVGLGDQEDDIHMVAELNKNGEFGASLFAPIDEMFVVGKLTVFHKEKMLGSVDLITKDKIKEANPFKKIKDWISLKMK